MAYIRFNVSRITDKEGNAVTAKVKRIESDMPSLDTLQPNMIFNALSFKSRVKRWLILDEGVLDRDMLMGAETLVFDVGRLDCDLIG